jgi:hypothetical protein
VNTLMAHVIETVPESLSVTLDENGGFSVGLSALGGSTVEHGGRILFQQGPRHFIELGPPTSN